MGSSEFLMVMVVGAVLLIGPVATLVLSLVAYVRSRRIHELTLRVADLERRVMNASESERLGQTSALIAKNEDLFSASDGALKPELGFEQHNLNAQAPPKIVPSFPNVPRSEHADIFETRPDSRPPSAPTTAAGWETFIGQKAFGWLAVLLFVLASAFFLHYAYQNNWIGPVGRVTIGELVGLGLIGAGWWHSHRGLKRFSSMLTATGIVVIYLATYSAFGFYQLLPQHRAGFFLAVLVFESMILAVLYRSEIIAVVAVLGGLLTPMLMATYVDDYSSFFLYLLILNAGVVTAASLRGWDIVSWVAFVGTQLLFALWYEANYHPDKFNWTLGFQIGLFSLYLAQSISTSFFRRHSLSHSELGLFVINALVSFLIVRMLLQEQYGYWLGSLALALATLYALVARMSLSKWIRDSRFCLASIAISVGFIASALPLQAHAGWVSLGWAAMGITLWWFGLRISNPLLRIFAGLFGLAAVSRLLMLDLPLYVRDPFIPVFNREALPSIGVALCILAGVVLSNAYLTRLKKPEQSSIAVAGFTGVLLLWLVLSLDCYGYFLSQSIGESGIEIDVWRWRGQLALTVFWAAFATTILVLGFQLDRARLRWLAIAIYFAAVIKLFMVDMANVQQLYRILVFFVLAIVLGLVARAYQRFK